MSVEISGPKGYEWQYRITSLIALQNLSADEMLVETPGSEDAKLTFKEHGGARYVELQAKSSKQDITAKLLCDWLTHFPARTDTGSLLERLLNGGTIAVFATEGRCADDTRLLIRNLGCFSSNSQVSTKFSRSILEALNNYVKTNSTDKDLAIDRKSHLIDLAIKFKNDIRRLTNALSNVVIWESISLEIMTEALAHALQRKHMVPQLECQNVILRFDEAVRASRDNRVQLITEVKRLLSIHSADALLGVLNHLPGMEENFRISALKTTNVSLLTGRSQCGKSHMAKFIGQQLQSEGVHAQMGNDVSEATRFLTTLNAEPRLFLLEDPFDDKNPADFAEISEILRRLIGNIKKHRFLIVTSTKEKIAILGNLLAPNLWIDLSVASIDVLMKFWTTVCPTQNLPPLVSARLKEGLENLTAEELPQFGHLMHLSRLPDLDKYNPDQLVQLSRFDIKQIASSITNRSQVSRRIHFALCSGASTLKRISHAELGYLVSESEERPGFGEIGITRIGGSDTQKFPKKAAARSLSGEEILELQCLEQSGHIRNVEGKVEFAHPDYLAVSKEIIATASSFGFGSLLAIVERALASLDENVAVTSTGILDFIYQHHGNSAIHAKEIFEVAKLGISSIFPAVRDAVSITLIKWLPALEFNFSKAAIQLIEGNDFETYQISWNGETPWITSENPLSDLWSGAKINKSYFDEVFLRSVADSSSSVPLPPSTAWDLVHFLESHPIGADAQMILVELTKQSHAFIRSKALEILISQDINNLNFYVETVLGERNPRVLRDVIIKIFDSWNAAEEVTRDQLSSWMKESLSKVPVAIMCSRFLVNFGDPCKPRFPPVSELSEKSCRDRWELWAVLFPIFLRSVAQQPFRHDGAHMYDTFQNACAHLGAHSLPKVIESWVDWIEGQLEMRILDDYSLSVATVILRVMEPGVERKSLIDRLLRHQDTGYTATSLRCIIKAWELLSESEATAIKALLNGSRPDQRWLRAIAMTGTNVPSSIQDLISGDKELLLGTADSIVDTLNPEVLSDSLHVFCGQPQPLWWYGFHHHAKGVWMNVLCELLKDPSHRDFDLALAEIFGGMPSASSPEEDNLPRIWRKLGLEYDVSVRKRLFQHLLLVSVRVNGPQLPGFWSFLLSAAEEINERDIYVSKIIENIEMISLNVDDLASFFGRSEFDNFIWPKMFFEHEFVRIIHRIKDAPDDKATEELFAELAVKLAKSPPRLANFHKAILPLLSRFKLANCNSVKEIASAAWHAFVKSAYDKQKSMDKEPKIWDWVTTCEQGRKDRGDHRN